jgi:hypothetical protein
MGAASSFAEADKFACREWAIGYTSGSISPTEAYRNQIFREIECTVICRKSDAHSGLSAPCSKPPSSSSFVGPTCSIRDQAALERIPLGIQ